MQKIDKMVHLMKSGDYHCTTERLKELIGCVISILSTRTQAEQNKNMVFVMAKATYVRQSKQQKTIYFAMQVYINYDRYVRAYNCMYVYMYELDVHLYIITLGFVKLNSLIHWVVNNCLPPLFLLLMVDIIQM